MKKIMMKRFLVKNKLSIMSFFEGVTLINLWKVGC